MIIALVALAATDLVVGVSNDAVNFLNSALGSKAISFKTIMIVASLGIAFGAIFSSGMMEVARKGIFVPGEFYFDEIMIIFMAVMITDILLLDFFNTLGMPTSTTVSIVFELLGSAVAIALIKISEQSGSFSELVRYINTEKATEIILGILLSVAVAFTVGALVQFVSRVLLSFDFQKKAKWTGALFGGVALAAITYFIFIKGLKGTEYYAQIAPVIEGRTFLIVLISLLIWTLLSYFLMILAKVNIYKLIILVGTFALALAFAGNDLVNFIGVPIAAWQSYEAWVGSGIPAAEFAMDALGKKVPAPTLFLVFAGLIMVVTLWLSSKARNVVKTSLDLSSQENIKEKFEPHFLSRFLVKSSLMISQYTAIVLPNSLMQRIGKQFEKPVIDLPKGRKHELPAFDMVRAAVNLMVASVLISIATSMKLPLSTTYVTFMVAMGTSLADRAWGSESAVYRVAGVLNVIGGWFFTALAAFTAAGIVAFLIHLGGPIMIAVFLLLAILLLARNYLKHVGRSREAKAEDSLSKAESSSIHEVIEESADNVSKALKRVGKIITMTVNGLVDRDLDKLKKAKQNVNKLETEIEDLQNDIFYFIKDLDDSYLGASKFYIDTIGSLQDIAQSSSLISKVSFKHVNNHHKKLKKRESEELLQITSTLEALLGRISKIFDSRDFGKIVPEIIEEKKELLSEVQLAIQTQVERTREKESTSPKNTTLYFVILIETKDLMQACIDVLNLYFDEHDREQSQ